MIQTLKWIALFLLLPDGAAASSVILPTTEQLTQSAGEIVYAKVEKVSSKYEILGNPDERRTFGGRERIIVSDITLNPIDTIKGSLRGKFVLTQLGGCVLDQCMSVSIETSFRKGETAVFFLDRDRGSMLQSVLGKHSIFKVDSTGKLVSTKEPLESFVNKIKEKVPIEQRPTSAKEPATGLIRYFQDLFHPQPGGRR